MEELINLIRDLKWTELEFSRNITIQGTDRILLERTDEYSKLFFLKKNISDDENITFSDKYSTIKFIQFPIDFNWGIAITNDLSLRFFSQFNKVFSFNENNLEAIIIDTSVDTYEVQETRHRLLFNPNSFREIVNSYNSFYQEGNSLSSKLVNFKMNEFDREYFGITRQKRTLTNKGEFNFLIERFNLPTKTTAAKFHKYLNSNDINSLQDFTLSLIQKEVFGNEFLTQLNDYFIKIRLEEIIQIGRKILDLKSPKLITVKAKEAIRLIAEDRKTIKQMETLWQKYFEKYLSFLIFSYQNLYSKIELQVDLAKKYPDFIGINHYGGVDIIEIKTHLKYALTKDGSHDNYAYSSEMSKAIIQTINYMDALIQEKIKKRTLKEDLKGKILEGNIYRPRGIIIISSYENLVNGVKSTDLEFERVKRDFTKLRNGLNNIQVLTFDEILNMAEHYKENIVK